MDAALARPCCDDAALEAAARTHMGAIRALLETRLSAPEIAQLGL